MLRTESRWKQHTTNMITNVRGTDENLVCRSNKEMQQLIVDYLTHALSNEELGLLDDPMQEFGEGIVFSISRLCFIRLTREFQVPACIASTV